MSDITTERDPVFGCELWTGKIDRDGYGLAFRGGTPVKAHLVAWREERGEVPVGMVLDHRCRRRACCNVQHLEPVTQSKNLHRRRWGVRVKQKLCSSGLHDMATYAMVTPEGGRLCRICDR